MQVGKRGESRAVDEIRVGGDTETFCIESLEAAGSLGSCPTIEAGN